MGNIIISNRAAARLREQLINKCFETGIGFRMLVNSLESGETTFSIKIDRQHQGDKVLDSSDVKVFFGLPSAALVKDYELDYDDESEGGFFLKTR